VEVHKDAGPEPRENVQDKEVHVAADAYSMARVDEQNVVSFQTVEEPRFKHLYALGHDLGRQTLPALEQWRRIGIDDCVLRRRSTLLCVALKRCRKHQRRVARADLEDTSGLALANDAVCCCGTAETEVAVLGEEDSTFPGR